MRKHLAIVGMITLAACVTGPAAVTPVAPLAARGGDPVADALIALNALCSAEAVGLGEIRPDLKLADGMGTGGFNVDTASADAQAWFDYGLALSHAFYHQDAKAAMKRSVELDPSCSMCGWGEAWAFSEGRGKVSGPGGFLVVDRSGETVFTWKTWIASYSNGLALVRKPI